MKFAHTIFSETFFQRFEKVFAPHLNTVGVDPRVLEHADIEIPEDQYLALWEAAGRVNPNIGLEIGSQLERNDIGALGHALFCAPNVGKALETLHRFIVVYSQDSRINYEIVKDRVLVEYTVADPALLQRRQDSEFAITAILMQLRQITGTELPPIRVDFEHPKPINTASHKRLFKCPIHFNQPVNRLHLPPEILPTPIPEGNERLYLALLPYLEHQRAARSTTDDLLSKVTRIIIAKLHQGAPTLTAVSSELGLSCRTLQRKLNGKGVEFSYLLEDVRRELALTYIQDATLSITEVSTRLGYAESGSFSRAFRRWTGQSPLQYRATRSL